MFGTAEIETRERDPTCSPAAVAAEQLGAAAAAAAAAAVSADIRIPYTQLGSSTNSAWNAHVLNMVLGIKTVGGLIGGIGRKPGEKIDGKAIAAQITDEIKAEVANMKATKGKVRT